MDGTLGLDERKDDKPQSEVKKSRREGEKETTPDQLVFSKGHSRMKSGEKYRG